MSRGLDLASGPTVIALPAIVLSLVLAPAAAPGAAVPSDLAPCACVRPCLVSQGGGPRAAPRLDDGRASRPRAGRASEAVLR